MLPLLQPALLMMLGIVVARRWPDLLSVATAALILLLLLLAAWGVGLLRRNPKKNFKARLQTVLIFASFFMLGILLTTHRMNHLQPQWPDDEITLAAVVASEPTERGKTTVYDAIVTRTSVKTDVPALVRLKIMRDERSKRITVGDGVVVRSTITPIASFGFKRSNFDYQWFMLGRGYKGEMFANRYAWQKRSVSLRSLSSLQRLRLRALRWRHTLLQRYGQLGLADDEYAVVAAMTLGDKSKISRQTKEEYSVSGAAHILALSGMHLGIIYVIFSTIFRSGRSGRRIAGQLLTLVAIWAYALLVGLAPSVVRAAVMITIMGVVAVSGRNAVSLNSLAFAAIAMLVANPLLLFDISFQMSFAAVAAILIVNPWLYGLISPQTLFEHSFLKWLWGLTTVSFSAQLGVAPLIAYYFGRFSPYFLPTNYVVIPAATIILYAAFALFCFPFAARLIVLVLAKTVSVLNSYISWISGLPGASIDGIRITGLQTLVCYAIFGCLFALVLRLCRKSSS